MTDSVDVAEMWRCSERAAMMRPTTISDAAGAFLMPRPPAVALPEKVLSSLDTAGCAVHDVDQETRAHCYEDNHRDPQRCGTAGLRSLDLRMSQRLVREPCDESGAQQRKDDHGAAQNQ